MRQFKLDVEKQLCWKNGTYRKIDGIFCEVISSKGNILKVKTGLKTAYIFFKDDVYAHGNTVKQAYYDWLFSTTHILHRLFLFLFTLGKEFYYG